MASPIKKSEKREAEKTAKWNDEAHKMLCRALMEALLKGNESLAKHSAIIMDSMQASGMAFTWEAIRQHIQKLRRSTTTASGGNNDASAPSTPKAVRAPRGSKGPKTPKTPRSAAKKRNQVKAEMDADDTGNESPTKKQHLDTDDYTSDACSVKKETGDAAGTYGV